MPHALARSQIKSTLSMVYFKMDKKLKKGKQKQKQPRDLLAVLMSCMKEVTTKMLEGRMDDDDEDEDDDDEEFYDENFTPVSNKVCVGLGAAITDALFPFPIRRYRQV